MALTTPSATSNSATVTWATDEPATSMVEYRRTRTTTWTPISVAGPRTIHSIMIGGLARRTSYEYRVTSIDAAGNSATSTIASFKTR